MYKSVALLCAVLSLMAAGCADVRRQATSQFESIASEVVGAPATNSDIASWNTETLGKAFAAINEKIGANPADYVRVTVTGYSVAVSAINPQKRENVDEYRYDGANVVTSPVDVSGNEPGVVEESSFKSDIVDPAVLATILGSAVKDSGVEDGKVATLTFEKFFANEPAPKIQVYVDGSRAHQVLRYTTTGEFTGIV